MGIWAMAKSPLIIGCDLSKIKQSSLNVLKNKVRAGFFPLPQPRWAQTRAGLLTWPPSLPATGHHRHQPGLPRQGRQLLPPVRGRRPRQRAAVPVLGGPAERRRRRRRRRLGRRRHALLQVRRRPRPRRLRLLHLEGAVDRHDGQQRRHHHPAGLARHARLQGDEIKGWKKHKHARALVLCIWGGGECEASLSVSLVGRLLTGCSAWKREAGSCRGARCLLVYSWK